MTSRPKLPVPIEEQVLTACRRRCALCFGLTRDTTIKKGQIAHVDGDRENNVLANLVFLCLPHHEEFDSRSRQAKGITPAEVRRYRTELQTAITTDWDKPTTFTVAPVKDLRDALSGHYVLETTQSAAELQVTHLGGGVMQVSGLALWGTNRPSTHTGSIDFVGDLRENRLYFGDRAGDKWYNLELAFDNGQVRALESPTTGYHGMNVSFDGTYKRISS